MRKFIKVTGLAGEAIWLNVDHIGSVYGELQTYIWHPSHENPHTACKESVKEIMEMING